VKPINFKAFEGRNIYSHRKCIKLDLNMEGIAKLAASEIDIFMDKLINLLPSLANHRCCLAENHRLMKNFKEKPYLHHICGHIAIALQNMIGLDVSFCSESKIGYGYFYTIYEYKYKNTGIEAGNLAVLIINTLLKNSDLDLSYNLMILESTLNSDVSAFEADSIHSSTKTEIPILAITGTNGKTTTTRLIAYALSKAGLQVGVTTTDGIYINSECIFKGDNTGPRSALEVLSHSEIDAAVLETARGGLVRNGLAYDLADVAVITNIADDHLGLDGIETMEDLANAKMLVGEAVKDSGYVVINGDNALSVSYLNRIKSKLIIFSQDKNNEALRANIQKGGYGVYTHDGVLFFENSDTLTELMPVEDITITFKGALRYNIQNAMAACGALMGFGISEQVIKEALSGFKCDEKLNPGRFNFFDVNGTHVILDYGHNIDGYSSVLEGLSNMPHRSLIGVIGVPGDRLDRTTVEVGRISGTFFNRIFIKEDKDRRGRPSGEIAELLEKGVLSSGFDSGKLEIVLDEEAALKEAIESSEPGDVVIVFFEEYAPLLRLVKAKIAEEAKEPLVVCGI
jgi:cyanophycin synthetase